MKKILMGIVFIIMLHVCCSISFPIMMTLMIGMFGFMVTMFGLSIGILVSLGVGIEILVAPVVVGISIPASLVLPNSSLPQVEYYINQEEEYSNYGVEWNWKWMGFSLQYDSRGTFEEARKMEDELVKISKLCNWNIKKNASRENEKDDGLKVIGEFRYNAKFDF